MFSALPWGDDHAAHLLAQVAPSRLGSQHARGRRAAGVGVYEAEAESGPDGRVGEEVRQRGKKEVRQLAQGARRPGVDLEVRRERRGRGRGVRADGVGAAGGDGGGRRGDGEVGEVVEGVEAVEELEVKGGRCLTVDLVLGRVARCHGGSDRIVCLLVVTVGAVIEK